MQQSTALIAAILACGAAGAQAPHKLEFEVASVHVAPPPDGRGFRVGARGGPGSPDPTRWLCENMTMFGLISRAYDVKDYQIAHPDNLTDSPRYNITARVPEGATKDDFRVMLQNLLTDRFKLKFHRETRQMPIYKLVVGKSGVKFKESGGPPNSEESSNGPKFDKDGYPNVAPGTMGIMSLNGVARARVNGSNEAMADLAVTISYQVDRPVVDATGLTGKYDFVLSWFPENMRSPAAAAPSAESASSAPAPEGPTLMQAIQEQLGLKLEAAKGPIEMFVVESFEKTPSEN